MLKPLSKAEYEHSERNRQRVELQKDIKRIEEAITSDDEVKIKEVHMLIDGKYSAYVPNWGHSMYGYNDKYGFNYELIGKDTLLHNLTLMKHSLEGVALGLKSPAQNAGHTNENNVSVAVYNSIENDVVISVSVMFEQARRQVEGMTSLTDEQIKEALDKISEIESILNGDGSKKSKWEKAKPILIWLADKSFDLGMTLLPLLLKLK